jgi:hypothetical protein
MAAYLLSFLPTDPPQMRLAKHLGSPVRLNSEVRAPTGNLTMPCAARLGKALENRYFRKPKAEQAGAITIAVKYSITMLGSIVLVSSSESNHRQTNCICHVDAKLQQ